MKTDMSETAEKSRAKLTTLAGAGWLTFIVAPALLTLYFVGLDQGAIVDIWLQHRDTRVHARRPALAGIPLPLASPVGQSEAATAQSSSATAASAQASALSTTSVAPASR